LVPGHVAFGAQLNLSKDPVQRHNMIMGPSKRVLTKHVDGRKGPINIHEKPDWLSEAIAMQYCRPQHVCGFDAAGDVRGMLNAGLNVVAIENDSAVASMGSFVPDSQTANVYTHEHIVLEYKNMALLKEDEEPAHSPSIWQTCKLQYQDASDLLSVRCWWVPHLLRW
jgi:hypothetical protein